MTQKSRNNWLLPSLGALVLWGFWAFLPKVSLQTMRPHSIIFYEALGNMLVLIPLLFLIRGKLAKDKKAIIITACSSTLAILAILSFYHALTMGRVAAIVTITAMYPVCVLIMARVFLGEKINRLQMLAMAMAMGAVLLLAG